MKFLTKQKKWYRIISFLLIFFIGLVYILSKNSSLIESKYSSGIYIKISSFLRTIFGFIPFSVGDVFYIILVLTAFRLIYILIWKKNRIDTLFKILAGISVFYFFFYFLWGLNYSRLPIQQQLSLKDSDYDFEVLKSFTNQLIKKTKQIQLEITSNDSIAVIVPYSKSEILKMTQKGYQNLSEKFNQFNYKPSSIKKSLISLPITYMGFSGYLNPFTGEAQVDYLIPKISLPMTCSHEVAHQLGIASESEANFIGYLAANFHNDLYFKYSANLMAMRYALSDIYRIDQELYHIYIKQLPIGIRKNIQETIDFWKKYENPTEPLFKLFYDNFLKYNQQKDGLKSYSKMVGLLISYNNKYIEIN